MTTSKASSLLGESHLALSLRQRVDIPQGIIDELWVYFRSDERLWDFDDRLFNTGFGGFHVALDMLAQWLVVKAFERGSAEAVLCLERYAASPFTLGDEVLALAGVCL